MKTIINAIDMLDANGTSYQSCIENYKRGNAARVAYHTDGLIAGTPKFEIPLSNEELQAEIEKENYEEHFMPRTIKLAVLTAIRSTRNIELPKNTAVIGVTLQGSQESYTQVTAAMDKGKKFVSPRIGATIAHSAICTTVSRRLGLTGPSFMISQACSSFIVALNMAEMVLDSGQAEAALVVGIDCSTNPFTTFIFNSMNVCTKTQVMPFDVDRSGMALGEAAVCVLC
jgi:3-oxoacyl-(acyl-carrier-protein) synthase